MYEVIREDHHKVIYRTDEHDLCGKVIRYKKKGRNSFGGPATVIEMVCHRVKRNGAVARRQMTIKYIRTGHVRKIVHPRSKWIKILDPLEVLAVCAEK